MASDDKYTLVTNISYIVVAGMRIRVQALLLDVGRRGLQGYLCADQNLVPARRWGPEDLLMACDLVLASVKFRIRPGCLSNGNYVLHFVFGPSFELALSDPGVPLCRDDFEGEDSMERVRAVLPLRIRQHLPMVPAWVRESLTHADEG